MNEVIEEHGNVALPALPLGGLGQRFSHFSWRSALAGVAVALATDLMLSLLGLAVGVTSVGPGSSAAAAQAAGIGVAVWYLLSMLVSIFLGGMVAGISSRDLTRMAGAIEGLVVWATTLLLMIWLIARGIGSILSAAAGALAIDPSHFAQE